MSSLFRIAVGSLFLPLAFPTAAIAGQCEDTFVKKGNMISGLRFTASQTVPDMPIDVAINQMRGIAAKRGYNIIASEPASGALLIEQAVTQNSRAFPVEINATAAGGMGTVVMVAKLRAGQNTREEAARTEMCAMLAELKGGRPGRQAAAAGASAITQQAAPIAMTAQAFASQISKDAERNATTIPARYNGKQFTLSGEVEYITADSGTTRIAFQILQPHEMVLRLPGMPSTISEVSCLMAPGTSVFTAQLKPKKSVKLTGTFNEFSDARQVTWFKDCRPAT
jgi:hypothetical protein